MNNIIQVLRRYFALRIVRTIHSSVKDQKRIMKQSGQMPSMLKLVHFLAAPCQFPMQNFNGKHGNPPVWMHVKHDKLSPRTLTQFKHHLCREIQRILVIGCTTNLIPHKDNTGNITPA